MLAISGCSRVTIAYNTADFFAKQYAIDYLDLASDQVARWEPRLEQELARHRSQELPYLAAFFDQVLAASRTGFDTSNMACLTGAFRTLYERHARLAVELAAPLLADLTPAQLNALERRFREDTAEDRADLAKRNLSWEQAKRARRYIKAIEDWTGPLRQDQEQIVRQVTAQMPESESAVIEYRSRKRGQLIQRLKRGAGEPEIDAFMTAWLVDFSDLPQSLRQAGEQIEAGISTLFIRLGSSFDETQRRHLEKRLERLRDDLMELQKQPRLAPLQC
ncbi:hypothetical protein G3480_15415 [Thiorhodococcus mannitoliphagus]|uniref:Uncharacterized protein n=1 Tax=Thiorhodococcus mannitoliphagus TaxID=329406 RepID=A0A6P1DX46_9GAMM|nr:DUF6279 family lipoprotein [Thiorhodococcus mannitoliphagus]NEX21683.1 hypothetical protein [Thiorhodococcus mannitoliphagus]